MSKVNMRYIYTIQDDLLYLTDYIPYLLRVSGFEYRMWMDNIKEKCSLEETLRIQKRLSKSALLDEQERMQELIEWLEDYPQYKDVLIW